MKRALLALLGAAALALGAVPAAQAVGNDAKGPACTDIIAGDGVTTGSSVQFVFSVAAPSCPQVTYTTYVVDERGDTTPIASSSVSGDGSTDLFFTIPFTDDDPTVCVYSTTSIGKHVFDRAPDSNCVSLTVDSGPPGQDYS
jgi:hypothetical protein